MKKPKPPPIKPKPTHLKLQEVKAEASEFVYVEQPVDFDEVRNIYRMLNPPLLSVISTEHPSELYT